MAPKVRKRIRVRGIVQGVGFRPYVWHLATKLDCTGFVCNDSHGVLIEIEGAPISVADFETQLQGNPPPLSRISQVQASSIPITHRECSFTIRSSLDLETTTVGVAPDVGICEECLAEMEDAYNRRYGYPFINCTHCGPRYTIIQSLPYDRQRTTMSGFPMCEDCRREYESPSNRRYHAEPNACSMCGPKIWFIESNSQQDHPWRCDNGPYASTNRTQGSLESTSSNTFELALERERTLAVRDRVRHEIDASHILAIKGIGGFHLACDATKVRAIENLRERKRRRDKPLAVMVSDLDSIRPWVTLGASEERHLQSRERPIVLLRKSAEGRSIDWLEALAPGNPFLGVMMAYSPLHHLLIPRKQIWVMTSGNLAEEPIAHDNAEAWERLKDMVDGFLFHDRPIYSVCDDSVIRIVDDQPLPIRRSRGYAPLPLSLQATTADGNYPSSPSPSIEKPSHSTTSSDDRSTLPTVLAVGGEIKAALCLASGPQAILSQHIGDMGNVESLKMLEHVADHLCQLYRSTPQIIVADQHPGYLSGQWAHHRAQSSQLPLLRFQHHHAHAAALMAEHDLEPNTSIIACVFDGTGFGTDGSIWGGEWLIANQHRFHQFASLASAPLPGGDACIQHPARTALAQLYRNQLPWEPWLAPVRHLTAPQLRLLQQQLERNLQCIETSSMGRLFDAVASLIGIRHEVHYEGQAAMELEALASSTMERETRVWLPYSVRWEPSQVRRLQCNTLFREIIEDLQTGSTPGEIGARFHTTLAQATMDICLQAQREFSIAIVGLTGGVFQNVLLTRLTRLALESQGFQVLTHHLVPPNDAGIALGQVVLARAQWPQMQA